MFAEAKVRFEKEGVCQQPEKRPQVGYRIESIRRFSPSHGPEPVLQERSRCSNDHVGKADGQCEQSQDAAHGTRLDPGWLESIRAV